MTRAGCEVFALADFAEHFGKILLVEDVECINGRGDTITVHCDPPARVRVVKTSADEIVHWCDDWLDPCWNVSLVEPHQVFEREGLKPDWVYGTSYFMGDGISPQRSEPSLDWTVEATTLWQCVKDWFRARFNS